MEVVVRPDVDAAVDLVARLVAARMRAKPDLVLGLATGRTMERVYDRLVALRPSFARARSFNLDEYIGLPPDDPQSYRTYMRSHLFDRVDMDPDHVHLPEVASAGTDGPSLKAAARHYEAAIDEAGGIDLQLLGIGETGHIGFNEPISSLMSRTRDMILPCLGGHL